MKQQKVRFWFTGTSQADGTVMAAQTITVTFPANMPINEELLREMENFTEGRNPLSAPAFIHKFEVV